MELQRTAAASTFVTFPMLSNTGVPQTGLTVIGTWVAWADTTGPNANGNPGYRTLTGGIIELGSTGTYTNALASTELPAASPYVLLRYIAAGVATQYLLVRTSSFFSNVEGWRGSVPNALVSGRVDADVGAMQSNTIVAGTIAADAIGASELAADAVAEIADGVWDEVITSGHTTDNTAGVMAARLYHATQYLDAAVSSRSTLTSAQAADAVWDEIILGDHSTDNTAGKMAGRLYHATQYLDAAVSSRSAPATGQTVNVVDTGAIVAGSFAAGAIDAAAIAANALGASELATDAVAEIADGVWDEVITSGHSTDNTSGLTLARLYHATQYLTGASDYADAFLGRTLTRGASGGRTVGQALMAIRNRLNLSAGTMTVYSTDDTTAEWTATVATQAVTAVVTDINPA